MKRQVSRREFQNQFPMLKIFEIDSINCIYDGKSGLFAEISQEEINQIYRYQCQSKNQNIVT